MPDVFHLVDHELLGQPSNGLALIEHLQIASQSILVTSHYEDPAIREHCATLGVRLIPKWLAGFVPIVVNHLFEVPGSRCDVPQPHIEHRTSPIEQKTGYRAEDFGELPWVKGILGKEPPWGTAVG